MRNRRAFDRVVIGIDRISGQRRCCNNIGARRIALRKRLTLDRAIDNPPPALFGKRDHPLARLDVAGIINRNRLQLRPIARHVKISGVFGFFRVQRLCHSHSATLDESDTCNSSGKLSSGQFERHNLETLVACEAFCEHRKCALFQACHDPEERVTATHLTIF